MITFDLNSFNRFVDGKSRPYSLYIIGLANHMMENEGLKLKELFHNFKRAATVVKDIKKQDPNFPQVIWWNSFHSQEEIWPSASSTMYTSVLGKQNPPLQTTTVQ